MVKFNLYREMLKKDDIRKEWKDFNIELWKTENKTYYCYFSKNLTLIHGNHVINFVEKKETDTTLPKPKGKVIFRVAKPIIITKGFKEMLKKDSGFFQILATNIEWLISFVVRSELFVYPEKYDKLKDNMVKEFWKELTKDESMKPYIVALKI
jgi:hypothetical protein